MQTNYKYKIIFEKLKEEKKKQNKIDNIDHQKIFQLNDKIKTLKELMESFQFDNPVTYTRS